MYGVQQGEYQYWYWAGKGLEIKDKPTDVHCLKIQGLLSLSISHW